MFTPEKSIQVQQNLGSDIMMAFDQPVYSLADHAAVKEATERTARWLDRSVIQWKAGDTAAQALFGIVQGGIYPDLHTKSAETIVSHDLPGNAIGGLTIGEKEEEMWRAVASIVTLLP